MNTVGVLHGVWVNDIAYILTLLNSDTFKLVSKKARPKYVVN
jgi:hypothetical protein